MDKCDEDDAVGRIALDYHRRGWAVVPVKLGTKRAFNPDHSQGKEWQKLRATGHDLRRWFAQQDLNVGVLLGAPSGGLVDIDLDTKEAVFLAPGFLPETNAIFGRDNRRGSHWLFESAGASTTRYLDPVDKRVLLEVRADGCQTVFPGSVHPSGERIEWDCSGDPAMVRSKVLKSNCGRLAACALLARHWPGEGGRHDAQLTLGAFLTRAKWPIDEVAHFLASVAAAAGGDQEIRKRRAMAEDCARRLAEDQPLRGFPRLAETFGEPVARAVAEWLGISRDPVDAKADSDTSNAPSQSEERLALAFAHRHSGELRFVEAWGRWMIWDGARWRPDETLATNDLVRPMVRELANSVDAIGGRDNKKSANRIASAKTVSAVERLARSDRKLAATVDQWDAHPNVLATPAGYVDLSTGEEREPKPSLFLSKSTRVAVDRQAAHPLWDQFLKRVTDGDAELAGFLQRMAGYCLTGLTTEHALFFLYGTGRNGKGVFVNTLSWVLGNYAVTAPMETFTEQRHAQHPTDLAMMRGARLVCAQETEEGRRWAESRIKQMTGGDPISARFMRRDFFTFMPQFKLVIAGNHKPSLRSVDEAIRARVHLIPFTVTIPKPERDKELAEKLRDEGPAILNWALEGCLEWRRRGLDPPRVVREATKDYLSEEDAVGRWLDDRCEFEGRYHTSSQDLYASWKEWAESAGEFVVSQKRLAQALIDRGFAQKRMPGGRSGFLGLRLRGERTRAL